MTYLSLTDHPDGISVGPGNHVVYDLAQDRATFGSAEVATHALMFRIGNDVVDHALLSAELDIDTRSPHLLRCDRVDFPPGGVAHLHTHPGPGIRCQLFGQLTVSSAGDTGTYRRLQAWFESGPDPVYAEASTTEPGAFVRAMVLPTKWAGQRTIRYVDPADAEKPKLQKATVFGEIEITLK